MDSPQGEERTLRIIMLLALVGLADSLYLSYLHYLVAGGGGCPTQDLPGLDCGVVLASAQSVGSVRERWKPPKYPLSMIPGCREVWSVISLEQ